MLITSFDKFGAKNSFIFTNKDPMRITNFLPHSLAVVVETISPLEASLLLEKSLFFTMPANTFMRKTLSLS